MIDMIKLHYYQVRGKSHDFCVIVRHKKFLITTLEDWCSSNCRDEYMTILLETDHIDSKLLFRFTSIEDASLFKLTWV